MNALMRRPYSPYTSSMSFGPGPLSNALKALIGANVLLFIAQLFTDQYPWGLTRLLGLHPYAVIGGFRLWQPVTYMFLHGGVFHLLFNMLALWMFGTELERMWGMKAFLKFYFVTGVGAGLLTVAIALLPFSFTNDLYVSNVIGASGAIYGLLLAYALYFPDRKIYMYFVFPIPAKYFVMIMGALALYSSLSDSGIANATHLGGLVVAYVFLKSGSASPLAEFKYRYLKWKINRTRKKFDVYSGGKSGGDWDRRVH
jgi:membrane associated rhomboid family serine protease